MNTFHLPLPDIFKTYLKKSCVLIWNDGKYDQKWFSVIQNGRGTILWIQKCFSDNVKWMLVVLLWKIVKKTCIVIWNGKKCDRKWSSGIHFVKQFKWFWGNQVVTNSVLDKVKYILSKHFGDIYPVFAF